MDAGENLLISSFSSFCSFRNFFISSTSLQTGSGTVSFLQAFGPVLLALSDLIPPSVTVSSFAGAVVAAGAAAGVVDAPKRLGVAAALVALLPNRLVPVPPRLRVDAVGAVEDAVRLPNREVVFVVVAGLEVDRFPNSPPYNRIFNVLLSYYCSISAVTK